MTQIASEREARLTYLKRELAKSVTPSRYFNQRNCHYEAPTRAIPQRVKKLIGEIEALEKDMGPRKAEELRAQVSRPRPRQIKQ
ncbi:hypothetical protein ES706_06741 [subsurface metagenome]